jgi:hypothetical protein
MKLRGGRDVEWLTVRLGRPANTLPLRSRGSAPGASGSQSPVERKTGMRT